MFRRRRKTFIMCAVVVIVFFVVSYLGHFRTVLQTEQETVVLADETNSFQPTLNSASTASAVKWSRPKNSHPNQTYYADLMTSRRNQMLSRCHTQVPNPRHINSNVPFISKKHHYLHCPLTKAASTFWNRFVLVLDTGPHPTSLPFTFRLDHSLPKTTLADLGSSKKRVQFLRTSTKTLFVREPYHRMFSAYVDKVFGPNPYYWKEWGAYWRRYSHEKIRTNKRGIACYHDLKFSQVMAVAAETFHKSELHFMPAFVRCLPCDFKYDVIGKMETFSHDLKYISQLMNLSLTEYFSSKQFRLDYAKDAIEDSVNSPFGWEKEISRCMNKYEMGLRIWRKLQIRGLIDRRILFPFSQEEFQKISAAQLIDVAFEAHVNSTDREELKRQKRQAFVEVYRTVDLKIVHRLQEVFKEDFLMFGYDSAPEDVFDRQGPLTLTGALNWTVPWTGR